MVTCLIYICLQYSDYYSQAISVDRLFVAEREPLTLKFTFIQSATRVSHVCSGSDSNFAHRGKIQLSIRKDCAQASSLAYMQIDMQLKREPAYVHLRVRRQEVAATSVQTCYYWIFETYIVLEQHWVASKALLGARSNDLLLHSIIYNAPLEHDQIKRLVTTLHTSVILEDASRLMDSVPAGTITGVRGLFIQGMAIVQTNEYQVKKGQ